MDGLDEAQAAVLFESLVQHASVGVAFLDDKLRYLAINERLAQAHGTPAAAHLRRHMREVVPPELFAILEPVFAAVLRGESISDRELVEPATADHGERHWRSSYFPVRAAGAVIGIGCLANEVTEQVRAERRLAVRSDAYAMLAATNRAVSRSRDASELWQQVCDIAVGVGRLMLAGIAEPREGHAVPVAVAGEHREYVERLVISLDPLAPGGRGPIARAFREGTGVIVNDFLGSEVTSEWHEAGRAAGIGASAAFPIHRGEEVVAVLTLYSRVPGYFSKEIVGALSDLAPSLSFALERFAEEERRAASERELVLRDRAIQAISQGILISDARAPGFPVIYVSPSFERLSGYTRSELLERGAGVLQGPETDPRAIAELEAATAAGRSVTVELLNYRKDGSTFWSSVTISPVRDARGDLTHYVGVHTDVTQRRQLEARYLQAQKMESIGTMASGIAHDFNNILSVVRGYAAALDRRLEDEQLRELTAGIDEAVERAAAFTRQLVTFSRHRVVTPQRTDLEAVVRDTLHLLERVLGSDVEIRDELGEGLPAIFVDPAQVQQAILNLVTNAREAMPAGGVLSVATSLVEVGAADAAAADTAPGPRVLLEVSDTGTGMDAGTESRVFDPFFTTKANGTGLGLATVYGIMKQSGGHVVVSSELGAGTTFSLFFPLAPDEGAPLEPEPARAERLDGDETLLVAEDNDEVRHLLVEALREFGYEVVDAENGAVALERAARHEVPIDVLVTDVVMPELGGRDLARALCAQRNELKVLFVSGHPAHELVEEEAWAGRAAFLAKPYTAEAVCQAIRRLVDAEAGSRDD